MDLVQQENKVVLILKKKLKNMKKILYILCLINCLLFIKNSNFISYACANQSNAVAPAKIVIPNVNKSNGSKSSKNCDFRKVETYIFDPVNKNKIKKRVIYAVPCNVKFRQRILEPIEIDESLKDSEDK